MSSSGLHRFSAVLAAVAAYGLLYLLFVLSREFAHTYAHWIDSWLIGELPRLTLAVLPAIGIDSPLQWAGATATLGWLLLMAWPAAALAAWMCGSQGAGWFGLLLLTWCLVLLSVLLVVVAGLWAPFSLL